MQRSTRILASLAALFFGPFLIAILLYAGRGSFGGFDLLDNPDREFVEGELTIPLAALQSLDGTLLAPDWARSRWTLIYARISGCEEQCVAALTRAYQVHEALGGERDRVQLALMLRDEGAPAGLPADWLQVRLDTPESVEVRQTLGPERLEEGRFFIVDPLGNIILSYPGDADQSRFLRDLERLLDVSRVG